MTCTVIYAKFHADIVIMQAFYVLYNKCLKTDGHSLFFFYRQKGSNKKTKTAKGRTGKCDRGHKISDS